jgi:hypothetical protein
MTRGEQRRWRPPFDGCAADPTSRTRHKTRFAVVNLMSTRQTRKALAFTIGSKVTSSMGVWTPTFLRLRAIATW